MPTTADDRAAGESGDHVGGEPPLPLHGLPPQGHACSSSARLSTGPGQTLVCYPGRHSVAPGKSQTDSVEADNAELLHSLAR